MLDGDLWEVSDLTLAGQTEEIPWGSADQPMCSIAIGRRMNGAPPLFD
jgi:hypothetical protein